MNPYQILIVIATVLIIFVGAALRMWWIYGRPIAHPGRHRTGEPSSVIVARLKRERPRHAPAFA